MIFVNNYICKLSDMKFKQLIVHYLLPIFLLFGAIDGAHSQMVKQPDWNYKLSKTEAKVGDIIEIILTTNAPKDWYIYSTNIKCVVGPIKAEFTFDENKTFEPIGELYSVGDKKEFDDILNVK